MHALRTCIVTCHTPTYCIYAHTNTSTPHTHTHTHTHTHGLVKLAETLGSYFSHKSYMSMNVHTLCNVQYNRPNHMGTRCMFGYVQLNYKGLILWGHDAPTLKLHVATHTHRHSQVRASDDKLVIWELNMHRECQKEWFYRGIEIQRRTESIQMLSLNRIHKSKIEPVTCTNMHTNN